MLCCRGAAGKSIDADGMPFENKTRGEETNESNYGEVVEVASKIRE